MRYKFTLLGLLLLAGLMVLSQGCATIVGKGKQSVDITSEPSGATVTIYNNKGNVVFEGTTPAKAKLKPGDGWFKGQDFKVEFRRAGYRECTAEIERTVGGWYIVGNFFFGGIIGWVVIDPLTGAMWTLHDLHMDMESAASSQETGDALKIIAIDQVPKELRGRMVRIN